MNKKLFLVTAIVAILFVATPAWPGFFSWRLPLPFTGGSLEIKPEIWPPTVQLSITEFPLSGAVKVPGFELSIQETGKWIDPTVRIPTPTPVPAPAAAWLLGSGLVGLALIHRRWRHPKGK